MNLKGLVCFIIILTTQIIISQQNIFSSLDISPELKKNANAVLRVDNTDIEISSVNSLRHSYRRVITILNKKGDRHLGAYVFYDDDISIRKLKATVYDISGQKIKDYKKSDFIDQAAVSDFSLYEDSRVKFLEYTPNTYPYTLEFYYETVTSNTAYLPFWRPLEGYLISTENSSYEISYDASVGIQTKEKNFSNYNIENKSKEGILHYSVEQILAIKPENYSPKFKEFGPRLFVAPKHFHYEGYYGDIENWEALGKWIYDNLLLGRSTVSNETKKEILNLVKGVRDPIEKARIVYDYVQKNTRYISVQVGIGGIQPISAQDVDKVKYGDCKGLTNYTKALLDLVGVESYYTEVYAEPSMQYSMDKDFASLLGQANHVILNIPNQDENIWLECTSQTLPFGYLGDFTDNRDVLVITPQGGKVMRTTKYTTSENSQETFVNFELLPDGSIKVKANRNSRGIQYDNKYFLKTKSQKDIKEHYKDYWGYVNNLEFTEINLTNNEADVEFVEEIEFKAANYANLAGDRMLLVPNVLNRKVSIPDRYRSRKLPLKILRGFVDKDVIKIKLPIGYKVEALPQDKVIKNKFGRYKTSLTVKDKTTIEYHRELIVNDGEFPKEDYDKFRSFYKEVARNDNSKIALIKTQI